MRSKAPLMAQERVKSVLYARRLDGRCEPGEIPPRPPPSKWSGMDKSGTTFFSVHDD